MVRTNGSSSRHALWKLGCLVLGAGFWCVLLAPLNNTKLHRLEALSPLVLPTTVHVHVLPQNDLGPPPLKVLCMYPLGIALVEDPFFALMVEVMSLRCASVYLYLAWNQTEAGSLVDVDNSVLAKVTLTRPNVRIQRTILQFSNATYLTMWEQVKSPHFKK